MTLNKRTVTKFVVKTVVMSSTGSLITKMLLATIPSTEKFNIAEITGAVGGWYVSEELQPYTDQVVDDFYDSRESKKKINTPS